jgi:hypothetical protein
MFSLFEEEEKNIYLFNLNLNFKVFNWKGRTEFTTYFCG